LILISFLLATLFRSLPWHGLLQYKGDDATSLATLIPKKISSKAHNTTVEHPHIAKLLHLYNYEASPFCRMVREALDSLEIPYVVHNHAHGSPKRQEYIHMSGKMQFPFLVDDNNGKRMFESAAIIEYLYKTYSPKKK
jgi:glutaredoxin